MDEELKDSIPYGEARSRMARMMGNFSYGFTKKSLAGFLDEMVLFFAPDSGIDENVFVNLAHRAWEKRENDV